MTLMFSFFVLTSISLIHSKHAVAREYQETACDRASPAKYDSSVEPLTSGQKCLIYTVKQALLPKNDSHILVSSLKTTKQVNE